MTVLERQKTVIDDLNFMPTADDKLEYVIELGKNLPALPEELKSEEFLVPGCISRVWLVPSWGDGQVRFQADSEAIIVKGLVALLLEVYSGAPPAEILAAPDDFLDKAGFSNLISVNRRNGLSGMIKKIRYYAQSFQAAQDAAAR